MTEDILPAEQLTSVLQQIRKLHLGTLNHEWYYENLHVSPVFIEPNRLVYKVEIPGVSLHNYVHYAFWYYPVPLNEHLYRIVRGQNNIVLDSTTNVHFDLESARCIGNDPIVCRPLKYNVKSSCESDLLSGLVNKHCKFAIRENKDNSTLRVYSVHGDENTFMLVGFKNTSVYLRCNGRPAEVLNIWGPTKIVLEPSCTLDATEWRVQSLRVFKDDIEIIPRDFVELPKMNLHWPTRVNPLVVEKLRLSPSSELSMQWSELPVLEEPDKISFHTFVNDKLYLGLTLSAAVLVVICILYVVLVRKNIIKPLPWPFSLPKRTINPTSDLRVEYEVAMRKIYPKLHIADTTDPSAPFMKNNDPATAGIYPRIHFADTADPSAPFIKNNDPATAEIKTGENTFKTEV